MKTAEEFIRQTLNIPKYAGDISQYCTPGDIYSSMREFAKMHVQEALKQASEKAFVEYIDLNTDEIFDYTDVITDDDVEANVNKDSILNAYPLENIK